MDAQAFWDVIGDYNQSTFIWQCVILILIIASAALALFKRTAWPLNAVLGIGNMFIGIVFFLVYGTEPIQKYFATPLFLTTGFVFIYEAVKYKNARFHRPEFTQWILLALFIIYPLVSFLLGHSFPRLVTYIMPCPFISLSIILYSCCEKKNKLLLLLLTIWGLTGVKAFFVNALEDTILLICGLFCLRLLIKKFRSRQKTQAKRDVL